MHRLELDFRRSPAPSRWSWVLLGCGVAVLSGVLVAYQQTLDETRGYLGTIRSIEAQLPGASRAAQPAEDLPLATARRAVAQGKQPWSEVLAALEAAYNRDVALLAFDPEPARGQLKIHAEARNLAAMLAYNRRLQEGGALRQVALLEHDIAKESPETPVRFHIVANWGSDRGRP